MNRYLLLGGGIALAISLTTNAIMAGRLSDRHDELVLVTNDRDEQHRQLLNCREAARLKAQTEATNYEGLTASWQERCAAAYDAGRSLVPAPDGGHVRDDGAAINSGRFVPRSGAGAADR